MSSEWDMSKKTGSGYQERAHVTTESRLSSTQFEILAFEFLAQNRTEPYSLHFNQLQSAHMFLRHQPPY